MFQDISHLASQGTPFLFYTDYKGKQVHVYELDTLEKHGIYYAIDAPTRAHDLTLKKEPVSFKSYEQKFNRFIEEIKKGNTYLGNLTQPTKIQTQSTLETIFHAANARFKLYVKDHFVCFSPEPFVTIENNTIHTYPMKGTIDAHTLNAANTILKNKKEMAEHTMIVDLLRNDLSMVAQNVRVARFRYLEKIHAGEKELLHVSSHISGELETSWRNDLGAIIKKLLPAGSISGTPKKSTVAILDAIEEYSRGYFSGIFGVYDGNSLKSAVMIRFLENSEEGLIYKSGGGVTLDSSCKDEYQELIDKVYIP